MAFETDLLDVFLRSAESGRLEACIARNHTLNVELGTLGGPVWWDTYEANGWKLQVNKLSGWWRILNSEDVRVARGTTSRQLRNLLDDRPSSVFVNYLDEGFRFSRTGTIASSGKYAILIHGWGVRSSSMQELADELAKNGYDAFNYDYPTAKLDIEGHADAFLKCYRALLATLPKNADVYFLTHSMGALVLRGALSNMSLQECRQIKCIVMLGPPNRGSSLAYFGKLPLVSFVNASLGDMVPGEASFVSKLKEPPYMPPVGIIAGNMDGKVSIESTRLPEHFEYRHVVVKSTHPGLRKPKNVMRHILCFFEKLDFSPR